ncbi:hypothetical protein DPM19_14910 [Actinomadura craniellae]|uniref:Uncharacterized protein n=1 Tax=Actinomadura craniellae TaxID=2231787 RepID=A0A365H5I8_9ACTN|nr:DUF5719 family protein [Actinomadura craniellae]RAY14266.1 hypothetical protein DPM19_14910 [Actinomadura craniellae]
MNGLIRFLGYRYATALLVLVALLALYGAARLSRPGAVTAETGGSTPVTSAVLACPAPRGDRVRLSALAPPGARGSGRTTVTATPGGAVVAAPGGPGVAWAQDVSAGDAGSYTLRATGPPAAGLTAEQSVSAARGDDRGLAGTRCAAPGTDLWFVGPGPVAAEDIDLYITNVDAEPAAVDVLAMSGEGPLETTDGRGLQIEPYSTEIVPIGRSAAGLGEVAETAEALALRVRANTGRVAAAVRVRVAAGKGVDWLPLAPGPARSFVLPGLPAGSGERRLLVGVPGDRDARVEVKVITPDGTFAPGGQGVLDAPAASVSTLDLDRVLAGRPAAVRLVSDRPIVTGFTTRRGADVAFGTATAPLGPAGGPGGVAADNRFDASLLLTAPDGAGAVRIVTVDAAGARGAPQDVTVAAGRTLEVRVPAPAGAGSFGLLVTAREGSGPVHAARLLTAGRGATEAVTLLPVGPARTALDLPPVGDSLSSLLP